MHILSSKLNEIQHELTTSKACLYKCKNLCYKVMCSKSKFDFEQIKFEFTENNIFLKYFLNI